jgi:hypothetical protein
MIHTHDEKLFTERYLENMAELRYWEGKLQIKVVFSITTDGQSVNQSWCRAPFGTHDQIFSPI